MAPPIITNLPDSGVEEELDWQLRELLSACFVRTPCFQERRYYQEPPAHRWMIRDEGGVLAAHVAVHDKKVYHREEIIPFGGVAEVCVRPEFRRRGYVRHLLTDVHAWLRAKGVPFAVLYGATDIYSSSGYESVTNLFRDVADADGKITRQATDWAMVAPLGAQVWPMGDVYLPGPTF